MKNYLDGLITLGSAGLANKNSSSVSMIQNAAPLLSFSAEDIYRQGGACTKNLTIYIWVEGTDREADKATVGGNMKYKFEFIGIQKDECAYNVENIKYKADQLIYETSENETVPTTGPEILYSENGIDWMEYTNEIKLSDNAEVFFVRIAETLDRKSSQWRMFKVGEYSSD